MRAADLIDRDRELLALIDRLESGKPISQARSEIEGAAESGATRRRWRADCTARVTRRSALTGSVSSCASRSASFRSSRRGIFRFLIVSQKLPFALAAGCACVVKPSEMTSASTLHLARLLDEAGLPGGVYNVVTGYGPEVGQP